MGLGLGAPGLDAACPGSELIRRQDLGVSELDAHALHAQSSFLIFIIIIYRLACCSYTSYITFQTSRVQVCLSFCPVFDFRHFPHACPWLLPWVAQQVLKTAAPTALTRPSYPAQLWHPQQASDGTRRNLHL